MISNTMMSQEIKAFDYNEPNSNANYQQEISKLYNQIVTPILSVEGAKNGKINENSLLQYLKARVPQGKMFDMNLFKTLFNDLDRTDNMIDISEFAKKYIQAHEELKFNLEGAKHEHEKDKEILNDLQSKIYTSKNEPMTNNGMSQKANFRIVIGKIDLIYGPSATGDYFCKLSLNDIEKKTSISKGADINFIEKFEFPINTKNNFFKIGLYNTSDQNQPMGEIEIPLGSLDENVETQPLIPLNDISMTAVANFNPKLALVTSCFTFYSNQYKEVEERIKAEETKINHLSEVYEKLSDPYKYVFEETSTKNMFVSNALQNQIIDQVEASMKKIFRLNDVKWIKVIQILLYFSLGVTFITNLTKNDFISLFVELAFIIVINTEKTAFLFEYFKTFLSMLLITVVYDVCDYLFLRNVEFDSMKGINSFVGLFSFFGFLGKILLVIFIWICKVKYGKKGML